MNKLATTTFSYERDHAIKMIGHKAVAASLPNKLSLG